MSIGAIAGVLGSVGAGSIGFFIASEFFELQYSPSLTLVLVGFISGTLLVGVTGTLATHLATRKTPVSSLRGTY